MTMSASLPPQAYTREVLVKAYDWLSTQAPSVKERATSADTLVGLYLQAKRRQLDESGTTRTVEPPSTASVEAFKEDLRNLAEGLRQFDDPLAPPPQHGLNRPQGGESRATPPPSATSPLDSFAAEWHSHATSSSSASSFGGPTFSVKEAQPAPQFQANPAFGSGNGATLPAPTTSFGLDARSRTWVQEVQRKLNLASESDALRALIAVGYERFRDILPDA